MPLHYEVTDINAIPESLRTEYTEVEENGAKVFRLQLDLPNGIKTALQRERDNARSADKRARDAEAKLAGAGDEALRAEVETLRRQNTEAEERHTRERAASELRIAEAIASNEMKDAVAKHRGNVHTLIPVLKTMTKVEAGCVVVLDAAGKPRDGVTVEQLVGELAQRDEYAGAFAGSGQSGGGSSGGDTSKGGNRTTLSLAGRKRSTMTPGEKAVGSSRVDLQACKLEYSIVSPK